MRKGLFYGLEHVLKRSVHVLKTPVRVLNCPERVLTSLVPVLNSPVQIRNVSVHVLKGLVHVLNQLVHLLKDPEHVLNYDELVGSFAFLFRYNPARIAAPVCCRFVHVNASRRNFYFQRCVSVVEYISPKRGDGTRRSKPLDDYNSKVTAASERHITDTRNTVWYSNTR